MAVPALAIHNHWRLVRLLVAWMMSMDGKLETENKFSDGLGQTVIEPYVIGVPRGAISS